MKKLALFTIILLIFGTISPSLSNNAYAQTDPSILLRIAVQADKQVVNQLNNIYSNQVPKNIEILYDKGHAAVKSLDESLSNNDIEKAKQDFLLAMNSFMQISRIMSQSSEKVVVKTTSNISNQKISNELDRLEKYVQKLESISKRHNDIAQSKGEFNQVYSLIKEIRDQINIGENPSKNINELKILVDSIKNDMRKSAAEKQSNSIKRFFERLIDKIDQKVIEVKNSGVDQNEIDKAKGLILEIRELLSKNQINSAKTVYSELKVVLKNIGISVKIT
ncbi:hypothetical protein OAP30_01990 [Nitrosopumilus sp.]|nr:hypothetical protein [Nitrosopumilus sp.]MDC0638198.1 hypothetical protein [Nitrosopumilus sp.]